MKFGFSVPEIIGCDKFNQMAFDAWHSMFNIPTLYSIDTGGYVHGKGYKQETIEMKPNKGHSIDPHLFFRKEFSDEIKCLNVNTEARIGMNITGKHFFSTKDVSEIDAGLLLRVGASGWTISFKHFVDKDIIIPEHLEKNMMESAISNLKYNKDNFITSRDNQLPSKHIGIGSCASTHVTTKTYREINVKKYIKKYGQEKLEKLIKENFHWRKTDWTIIKGVIYLNDSYTEVWD